MYNIKTRFTFLLLFAFTVYYINNPNILVNTMLKHTFLIYLATSVYRFLTNIKEDFFFNIFVRCVFVRYLINIYQS